MKFGPLQLEYFRATDGAYSVVTLDERKKGQITLTDADGEADIAVEALGHGNIPRLAADGRTSRVDVYHRTGQEQAAELTINFPKVAKDELRIYRKEAQGFDFEAGDIWFVFHRGRGLVVGAMSEAAWREIGRQDPDDQQYVDLAETTFVIPSDPRLTLAWQYPRNPVFARKCFERSKYTCEYDASHPLFLARVSGKPFLEPHHLVQVSLQAQFRVALDQVDNIFALCPRCHRSVHHGQAELVSRILVKLHDQRSSFYHGLDLTIAEVLRLYNCESIIR